jgi:uncharacterized protein (TIGR00661 family)
VVPILKKHANVDVLVSGKHGELQLPFEIKYRLKGLGFYFGTKGGVDVIKSIRKNNIPAAVRDIRKLPVQDYDLVINDFEPISAWSSLFKKVPCIGMSHQSAVIANKSPKPKKIDRFGIFVLRNYAPVQHYFGFHFHPFEENIFTPVIRQEIRSQVPVNGEHYTVYLPAYSDERIINILSRFPNTSWEVFSKHSDQGYRKENVRIEPICNTKFVKSLVSCKGFLTGAGFEAPAETLYLQKKLLVIPMSNQFEQKCNAAALKHIGVPVISALSEANLGEIEHFITSDHRVNVDYPDITEEVIKKLLRFSESMRPEGNYDYAARYFDYVNSNLRPTIIYNQLRNYLRQFPI